MTPIPSLEDIREKAMKTPLRIIEIPDGPNGVPCKAIQLQQGDTIQTGDWYLVTGHMHSAWHSAEPGMRLRDFHWPHIRVIDVVEFDAKDIKSVMDGTASRGLVFAILTSQTCGEACWHAVEDVCRCSCGGKNHGCLRVAGAKP